MRLLFTLIALSLHTFFAQDAAILISSVEVQATQKTPIKNLDVKNPLANIQGIALFKSGNQLKIFQRGFWGARLNIVQAGITQEEQQWSLSHGQMLSHYGMDDAQWLKSPLALVYAGNSFGGILLLEPQENHKEERVEATTDSRFQSNRQAISQRIDLQIVRHAGQYDFGALVDIASHLRIPQKDWRYRGENFSFPENGVLPNTSSAHYDAYFSALWTKNKFKIHFFSSYVYEKSGILPLQNLKEYNIQLYQIDAPNLMSHHAKWSGFVEKEISPTVYFKYQAGFQWNQRQEQEVIFIAHRLNLSDFQQQLKWTLQKQNNTWVFGLFNQDQYHLREGIVFLVPSYWRVQNHLFAFFSAPLKNDALWSAALRVQHLYYQDKKELGFESLGKNQVNYSFALGIEKKIHPKLEAKWNLHKVNRFPEPIELKSQGAHYGAFRFEKGNTHLKPEEGILLENDWLYRYKLGKIKLNTYAGYYWNYIFLRPTGLFGSSMGTGQIYAYAQTKTLRTGLEFSADITLRSFYYLLNFDYLYLQNLSDKMGLSFTPSPKIKQNLTYQVPFRNFNFSVGWTYTYHFPTLYLDINELYLTDYHLLDFHTSIEMRLKKQMFVFYFQVDNLFNQRYIDALSDYRTLGLPQMGRNIILGLKLQFF